MVELASLFALLTQVRQWLEFARTKDAKEDEHYEQAIEALYTALNETKIYIGAIKQKETLGQHSYTNSETEAQLSRLWMRASLKVRHYNQELADRCVLKWDYWTNPDAWTEAQIEEV